jgi:hypothetical protein
MYGKYHRCLRAASRETYGGSSGMPLASCHAERQEAKNVSHASIWITP